MPLFHKSGLVFLALCLNLFLVTSAQALEAQVQKRTPFCEQARQGCRPLFYLNPSDRVQVLQQSGDGKWLYVRYQAARTGWIQADAAVLKKPESLRSGALQPLPPGGLALQATAEGLQILFPDTLQSLSGEPQPIVGIKDLLAYPRALQLAPCRSEAPASCIYGVQSQEGQSFVIQVQPVQPPRYRTLLRLSEAAVLQGLAVKPQGLLLLAQGEGPWGESLLLGLGEDHLPFLLLKQAQEILLWVPQEVRTGLNLESVRLMHLNRDGVLLASAFHLGLRRHVLLRLRFDAHKFWIYEGLMHWPDQSAVAPREAGVRVQGLGAESDFYVLVTAAGKTWLAYYSGSQEPLAVQALKQPPLDAQLAGNSLWLLAPEGLRSFQPHFSP